MQLEAVVTSRFRGFKGEQGSAMVEFALSLVVLLTLLFGIIDIGRALYAYNWLYNGARQATRWAMVRGAFCDNHLQGCPAGATNDTITQYVTNTLPAGYGNGLDTTGIDTSPGMLTVTTECWSLVAFNNPPCAPTASVQVQLTYQVHYITPFLAGIKPWPMTSSSRRVVQGTPVS
jgi:Flp pilus assembly protein TadG